MPYEIIKEYIVKGKVFGATFTNEVVFDTNKSLEENLYHLGYMYFEGNYQCDCNKALFAKLPNEDEYPCGDTEEYEELKLYKGKELVKDLMEYKEMYDY